MAATRCLTVRSALVATDMALRYDLFAATFRFFGDFVFLATLRFVAIVRIPSCKGTLEPHVVVIESQMGVGIDDAMVVQAVPHARCRPRRADAG